MVIVTYPHPTLRRVSKTIRRVDADLQRVISEMFQLMYASRGIGLAANQVNLPLRLFVMNLEGEQGKGEEMVFLNPVLSNPKGSEVKEEGCLSLPELYADVERPKQIRIRAYGLDGQEIRADVSGMFARCAQHEVDHLDGVLFTDRVKPEDMVEVQPVLDKFQADFTTQRAAGTIPSDPEIAAELAAWEKRYC